MIEILKASAGSGKTFQLAKTYIRLLLASEDRYAYRHILAVTFTNKATEEMKSRILKELDTLARTPEESLYYEDFSREFGSAEALSERAGRLLTDMLHDYSAFAVSTIDRFFQRTLKAFAREIGQFASYQVELDKASLVREAVDRILDALTEDNKELLPWLSDSVMDQLSRGGRYTLEARLYEMAEALKSDEHRELAATSGIDVARTYSMSNLAAVRKGCHKVMADFAKDVAAAAQGALAVLSDAGVDPADSTRHFLSKLESYAKPSTKDTPARPTEAWMASARDPKKWFPASRAKKLPSAVCDALAASLDAFCDLFGARWQVCNTAAVLADQVFSLGIAGELYRTFDALVKEKNVMSLDDSNVVLSRIIAGSDAPFVYEKLGVRFEDFLLDEFQDTSVVQWENFRPLLQESHGNGRENLIVGDVKQSIYRWRGSDWNLLDSRVATDFSGSEVRTLQDNWRSCRTIVEFNNAFFPFAAERLDARLGLPERTISRMYADVAQTPKTKEKAPGSVQCTFCDKERVLEKVLESVLEARAAGAQYNHIAVLVRSNATGSDVAGFLVDNGIPVISDDSLRVKASVTVRRLVSLLSHAENRGDKVAGYLAASLDITIPAGSHSLIDLAEELLRSLQSRDEALFDGEILHIQSFMDELQDWVSVHGNHLGAFLKYWDDADPKISSPEGTDAVRIMTIHKAKGLEFPHVIFPFAESVGLFRPGPRWCRPGLDNTPLAGLADGIYRVTLSREKEDTLFAGDYEREQLLQYIDNINTFYVALTRAEKALHVIASMPSGACLSDGGDDAFNNFAELLYGYLRRTGEPCVEVSDGDAPDGPETMVWRFGEPFDYTTLKPKERPEGRPAGYPSFPLNPDSADASAGENAKQERLKLTADAADFFREDARGRSPRLLGVALHGILSRILVPGDLDEAVETAVAQGVFDAEQAERYRDFLARKIDGVKAYGWFPDDPSRVRNERGILGTDGKVSWPDRVVFTPEGVVVIDYKFGEDEETLKTYLEEDQAPDYHKQVLRYVNLYKRMGYSQVRGYLWYLREDRPDKIEEV